MKPILFNTEMVRAILEGRKTVTRRVVKPEQNETLIRKDVSIKDFVEGIGFTNGLTPEEIIRASYKAPYKVGDVLYVRETWGNYGDGTPLLYKADYPDGATTYKHDDGIHICDLPKWKPSIHMPKAAARIFLRVTSVSVERLQDMTVEDCHKEGVNIATSSITDGETIKRDHDFSLEKFETLWDSTIKPDQLKYYGWESNPYVWVIEFERVEGKCSD